MNILIIDDSVTFLNLMKNVMSKEGYSVTGVKEINKALSSINRLPPDLIILDLFLNNENGFKFLNIIKRDSMKKHIPIIVISSINKSDVIRKAMLMGAADFITKPINIQDLKNKCSLFFRSNT